MDNSIGDDGGEYGGRRPPTMDRRPYAGAFRIEPQNPYATIPKGGRLGKCGSLGMMGSDYSQVTPALGCEKPEPPPFCAPFSLGGGTTRKNWVAAGTSIYPRKGTPSKFWVAGADGHQSGLGTSAKRQPQKPVTAQHPP